MNEIHLNILEYFPVTAIRLAFVLALILASWCSAVQVKEKVIDQVYRNLPYSQRPKVESVALGETRTLFLVFFILITS